LALSDTISPGSAKVQPAMQHEQAVAAKMMEVWTCVLLN
jgi:hypothetical protein